MTGRVEAVGATKEMPRYACHKRVWALKIGNLEAESLDDNSLWMTPVEAGYARIKLDDAYVLKHSPRIGGYYVVYEDGYQSFSPASAFEFGYTKEQN